jgi:hypothetical protein
MIFYSGKVPADTGDLFSYYALLKEKTQVTLDTHTHTLSHTHTQTERARARDLSLSLRPLTHIL